MAELVIKEVDFSEHFADIEKIRTTVFIKEQNVPFELEWDEYDSESVHILACLNNVPVGTARLLKSGHIGRMAVLKEYRNQGVGRAILKYVLNLALTKSFPEICLSAQEHAVEFYKKAGFKVTSEVYMDAGIPHYDMVYTGSQKKAESN
ncbi:MAG: GNAT family N-acetyltransferase [Gammaproteobacteria bacterium]|nr:GNAT family N-acetyltransferase [Gammaproteobacteria bacterium]